MATSATPLKKDPIPEKDSLTAEERKKRLSNEDDFSMWRRAYLEQNKLDEKRGPTINEVSVKDATGKTSAQIKEDNPDMDVPTVATKYSPERIRANQLALIDRGQRYQEKVAGAEQAQRNQYRSFLADREEDPDTIGGATLQEPEKRQGETRAERFASVLQDQGEDDPVARAYALRQLRKEQSTPRGMRPPTRLEEELAQDATAQFHKERSIYTNAANRVRNPEVAKNLIVERDTMYPLQRSSEVNRKAMLARYRKPSPFEQNLGNSNGYGP
jgi:hypothetical protein